MAQNKTNVARGALVRDQILDAIEAKIEADGWPPTQAELAATIGLAQVSIKRHIHKLKEEGKIEVLGPGRIRVVRR